VLGDAIGKDVAAIATMALLTAAELVGDPFAGSGNKLYWLLRHLPGAQAGVRIGCSWLALQVYGLNAPGENHGVLLGTRGWALVNTHMLSRGFRYVIRWEM
jgi:hypothetical protein